MTRILVVDDEEIIRGRLKKLLEMDGYETDTAENGQKGLELFAAKNPDVVLLDIKMPGIDGIQVLEKMKETPNLTEVFIMTGHGGLETAIQAIRIGAFDYLTKPIDYDELEINIKRALEKQKLRQQLDSYVHDLEAAHRKLKIQGTQLLQAAKLTAVGELGAGVAHEMNQPLMSISTQIETLLMNPAISSDAKLNEKIKKIKDQFVRLGTIVKRMHEYSSGRSGTYMNESVNRPVRDGFYLFDQQLKDHNIQVSLNLQEDLPKIHIDRYQIQDVVMNFLVNARDAIDDVYKQEEGGKIEILSMPSSKHNCILVGITDNGQKIDEKAKEDLFNPFFTTKEPGKGTGLGLSVCYNIIKNHNGLIGFETINKDKKAFYFVLPTKKDRNLADEENLLNDITRELKETVS